MTCVIATPTFMCADRRITDDGEASSMVKIAKNAHLIAAAAGSAACTLAVKRAIRRGIKSPSQLVDLIDAESHALVLTPWNTLYRIESGTLWPCPGGHAVHAIGSGADLALGFLKASGDTTIQGARKAQRFVATKRVDCGGGCDVRFFNNKE